MGSKKYKILAFLIFISLASSLILTINELKPSPLICNAAEGCSIVSQSPYSKTFGIENAYIGLIFFLILFNVILSQIRKPNFRKEKIVNFGIYVAGIWAIYSLYLMEFVINAYCKYCTLLDISSLVAVGIVLYFRK